MALDPDILKDHISRRGRLMFHVTRADAVPAILAEGLRPGSERGVSSKGGFFKTAKATSTSATCSPWLLWRWPAHARICKST